MSASLLCLGHCLALPMILLMLPALAGTFLESETFHIAAAILVVPAAALAFILGYHRHRAALPALLGSAGATCLIAALFPAWGEPASAGITALGSLFLIGGHLINWRLRRTIV